MTGRAFGPLFFAAVSLGCSVTFDASQSVNPLMLGPVRSLQVGAKQRNEVESVPDHFIHLEAYRKTLASADTDGNSQSSSRRTPPGQQSLRLSVASNANPNVVFASEEFSCRNHVLYGLFIVWTRASCQLKADKVFAPPPPSSP